MPYETAEQLLTFYMVYLASMFTAIGVTALGFYLHGWRYWVIGGGVAFYVALTT